MLADSFIDQISSLNYIVIKARENKTSVRILEDYSADLLDHLFYLKDIYNTQIEGMDNVLTESIVDLSLKRIVRDVLENQNTKATNPLEKTEQPAGEKHLGLLLETDLYCLSQFYLIFSTKSLVEKLTNTLFSRDLGYDRSFMELVFQTLQDSQSNESLLSTSASLIYAMLVNECKCLHLHSYICHYSNAY